MLATDFNVLGFQFRVHFYFNKAVPRGVQCLVELLRGSAPWREPGEHNSERGRLASYSALL